MLIIYYFLIALAVIGLLIITFLAWSALKGAPWSPTSKEKVLKMLTMANIEPNEIVYDLGCGDGRVLIMAAKYFNARAIGIEIDPIRFLWCKFRIRLLGLREKVQVIYGDFFNKNLSNADIIICYLLQNTNDKLQAKLQAELLPQTKVISNKFVFLDLHLISKDDKLEIYAYDMTKQKP
ncbi:MAG: methyltransferase domain-containing protein [Candidatus Heimdallarchaeota archaeon]|nr:methyltransferase domain-containing protein [Candidatus Heimdallarchaeota archaeon]MCG3252421.1 methyltransferase domain-containing protein [Candidatus Heimdallarchaeota archaeon]MCK4289559.1 methyltransferase domain-containing protein [Candidatus Heimdallarchaeota archaeon]